MHSSFLIQQGDVCRFIGSHKRFQLHLLILVEYEPLAVHYLFQEHAQAEMTHSMVRKTNLTDTIFHMSPDLGIESELLGAKSRSAYHYSPRPLQLEVMCFFLRSHCHYILQIEYYVRRTYKDWKMLGVSVNNYKLRKQKYCNENCVLPFVISNK